MEDIVSSNFIYDEGRAGLINVNWSDQAYRKPANIVKIFGTKGKIVADKHAYKIYMREADEKQGFEVGWNTRYITDFAKSVRFMFVEMNLQGNWIILWIAWKKAALRIFPVSLRHKNRCCHG